MRGEGRRRKFNENQRGRRRVREVKGWGGEKESK